MGCPLSKTDVESSTACIYKNDAERATWGRAFASQTPLSDFSSPLQDELFLNSVSLRFAAGSSVCVKGEMLDEPGFFVLMRGSVSAEEQLVQGTGPKGLEEGDCLGLQECLHGVAPLRTMKAKTSVLMRLIKKGDVERAFSLVNTDTVTNTVFFRVLKATPVFLGLADVEIISLIPLLRHKTFGPGEKIVERGERGEEMYILVEGCATVSDFLERDESPTGLRQQQIRLGLDVTKKESVSLSFPNYFGEGALLVDEEGREKTRMASIDAGPAGCSVLVCSQKVFDLHLGKVRHRFHRNIYSREQLVKRKEKATTLLEKDEGQGCVPHRALLPSEVKARGLWRVDEKDVVRRHDDESHGCFLSDLLCGGLP